MKQSRRFLLIVALLCASAFGGFLANSISPRQVQAAALAAFGPGTKVTLFDVPNASTNPDVFGSTAVKISDVGSFVVQNSASLVEVTHQGRLYITGITGNGVYFELRVDDATGIPIGAGQPSGMALLRDGEETQFVPSTFSGYWQNLSPGAHTVSVWVRAANVGWTGDNALLDPGGWNSNIVIVKEYLPFGSTLLPVIER